MINTVYIRFDLRTAKNRLSEKKTKKSGKKREKTEGYSKFQIWDWFFRFFWVANPQLFFDELVLNTSIR